MGKVAFLFAGQGAQHPGMADALIEREPAAQELFGALDARMPGLIRLCREWVKGRACPGHTHTQPAVFACDLAVACALKAHGVRPQTGGGFLIRRACCACICRGRFSYEDCV
jgi:[acyl-carrier-protein] S-malonyltransferase